MTRGRIESHKVLSEVRDLFNALVQSNCGIQSGASFKPEEKLGFDSVYHDVNSPFVSHFRTEAVEHKDAKWRFPLESSSTAGSFMQVTDLDNLFEGHLVDSTNEVPLSTALNAPLSVVGNPVQSHHVEPTDRFLVTGDFGQRTMESKGSIRNFEEATHNDDGCVEEVQWERESIPQEVEWEREHVPQERAREENEGLWVSEARISERTEIFVCRTVFDENKSEAFSENTSALRDAGRYNKETNLCSMKDTSKNFVTSPLSSDFRKTEEVREETKYENICGYEEHEQLSDLENESRPSLRTELTVQSMYPHTQNLLKFISSEVISLRRSDAGLSSGDEVRLQSPFENGENQSHQPTGQIPENDLSIRNWHTDESQDMLKESVGQTKRLEQLESPITSTCIVSESAGSKNLVSLTDYDWLDGPQPTNEENVAKRSETTNKKLEKTSNVLISKDNSGKTENRKQSTMVPCSETLQTSMPFKSYSSRKLKYARAAMNDLSNNRINSPKPSRKLFSVIDIDLDSDPSVLRAPRTNFEELKQKLASVRLRAPPSPTPDKLWNTADEILARFRSRERGLNALGSDDASRESTDQVDAAIRRARSLSLLPNSYRAVKRFEPLAHDPANMSSNSLNSPSSPNVNDDDKFAKTQSLLDLRNNARLSVFSGNDLKNQGKNLSKSELRLYESLQQLDIPDWFQNSARRHQEIVIMKNTRSIENILSDCSFSSAEYHHKFETKEPVAPKPVVIAHYVSMPTYENKQATKPACVVSEFELPSAKLRGRSRSHFHPIKTRSFEEIMKSKIEIQTANDETKDEIEKSSENRVSKEELSREDSVEKRELFPLEGIEMSFAQENLPEQHSVQEMDPKSVTEMYTQSTTEELSSVSRQHRFKKNNEVHSSDSSEEKHPRRHNIRIGSPIPSDEILYSTGLTRKNSSHEERYPPSVAETQLLRRNSLKKSFSEEKYPFSAAQKYSVKDQISSDSEGAMHGRSETEIISSISDSEKQRIRTRKLTKKSQNSELLSGERKKKKLKNSCDFSHTENKELDAEGMTWQVEQRQGLEGQVEKREEEAPNEVKRRAKKKRSTRTDEVEEPAEKEASVTEPSTGDVLHEDTNELLTYKQKHEQEDSRGQIKRRRRKRPDVRETNELQDFENSNQKLTSCTDVDSGFTVLENNCLMIDDMHKVQADELSYSSLGKAVKLKKPKPTKISERDLEIIDFFGNQDSVMHEVADNIPTKKLHRRRRRPEVQETKLKESLDLDLRNERLEEVTNSSQLDLITSQEMSTDDSFADHLRKSRRKVKTKFQEVDETVVNIININEPNESNALEAGDPVLSVDNKVKVSRKKGKSSAKKDLDLSREQNVQSSIDNREFTETSSFELNEMTGRTASDFQVSVSEAQSQKPFKKVKRKKLTENSENSVGRVHLNWEEPNNDNPSTRSNVLTDEQRKPEEGSLAQDRVIRKTKMEGSIEDMPVVSASAKPRKKLNEEDASVISDSIKVRKRLKNRVSEVTNSDQGVNVSNDCSTGEHSGYSMEQVDRLHVTHPRGSSVSQGNLSDNRENILSHTSPVASGRLKKTKKKRVTDSAANEAENGFVPSKTSQTNQSPHQIKVRLVTTNQRSAQCTADSSDMYTKQGL